MGTHSGLTLTDFSKLNLRTMKLYCLILLVVLSVCCQLATGCNDKRKKSCPGWKQYCVDPNYSEWMKENCKKTCNACPAVAGSGTFNQFAKEGLESHNKRRKLGGPSFNVPLKLDKDLCDDAQAYADQLAANDNGLIHASAELSQKGQGENLAWASPITWNTGRIEAQNINAEMPVKSWYNELKTGQQCMGHYTQVVWKGSKKFCMAKAVSRSKATFTVARYYPAGNVEGAYAANVPNASALPCGLQ